MNPNPLTSADAWIPRRAAAKVRQRLAAFPAVTLIGPRQCGKTTLAQTFASQYYDLEQSADRLRLDLEWRRAV